MPNKRIEIKIEKIKNLIICLTLIRFLIFLISISISFQFQCQIKELMEDCSTAMKITVFHVLDLALHIHLHSPFSNVYAEICPSRICRPQIGERPVSMHCGIVVNLVEVLELVLV
jgi:uncharacterized membrane protein YoaT (DUF817 family)